MKILYKLYFFLIIGFIPALSGAKNIYVSIQGDDLAAGTLESPYRTIQYAADVVQPGDTVWLREGSYRESVLPPSDGTEAKPIVFCAFGDERVVISGGDLLSGWTHLGDGIWEAPMNSSLPEYRNQLFINGNSMTKARWPNITDDDPLTPEGAVCDQPNCSMATIRAQGGFPDTWTSTTLQGASIWIMAQSKWRAWPSAVTAFDPSTGTLRMIENTQSWYTTNMNPGKPCPHNYGVSYFILSGSRGLLDAPGEWWYDRANNKVLIMPPQGMEPGTPDVAIEAKKRDYGFVLNGRSYIHIQGIQFRGTAISMKESQYCSLKGLYFYEFDYREGSASLWYQSTGIIISGQGNLVRECEFTRSSDAGVTLQGRNNSMINCYLHEVDYAGFDGGPINLGGQGHLVSHNTVERTSRKGINPGGLGHLIQYNHIREVGLVTRDLAAVFCGGFDGGNTVIRNNWVNVSNKNPQSLGSGIYMDNWHQNVIVHHNIVWNTPIGLICNRPGNYDVWAHNTVEGTIRTSYGPWIGMETLHGTSIHNNWSTGAVDKGNYCWSKLNNHISQKAELNLSFGTGIPVANSNTGGTDGASFLPGINDGFEGPAPDIGVLENGKLNWSAGHDFSNPPSPVYEPASFYYRNYVINGSFDFQRVNISPRYDRLYRWTKTGQGSSSVEHFGGFNYPAADQRNSIYANSLHLEGSSGTGVEQAISNLPPGHFILSAYVRLVDPVAPGTDVILSILKEGEEVASRPATYVSLAGAQKWRMVKVPFVNLDSTDISIRIALADNGEAYVDNIGVMPVYADDPYDIQIDTCEVVFEVRKGSSGDPLSDCSVTFNNHSYNSDAMGTLSLEGVITGQYNLLVEKEGFEEFSRTNLEIFSDTVIVIKLYAEPLNLSFQVLDLSKGDPVYRAKLFVSDILHNLTNSEGLVFYEFDTMDSVSYRIEHEDFHVAEGRLVPGRDTSLIVQLIPRFATLLIYVEENGSAVSAKVSLSGRDYTTQGGLVNLYQPTLQSYDYSVLKDAYENVTGSLFLRRDTSIHIELIPVLLDRVGMVDALKLYPVPASDILYMDLPGPTMDGLIWISNSSGEMVLVQTQVDGLGEIDISTLDPGVYSLRYISREAVVNRKFIKIKGAY